MMVNIRSRWEIEAIRRSCKVVSDCLNMLREYIKPGVNTKMLDELANRYIISCGARPAFYGYRGFPASTCISINDELVHGIPSVSRVLCEGDCVTIDVGVEMAGYFGDGAVTYNVGEVNNNVKRLMEAGKKALFDSILEAKIGGHLYDISAKIEEVAKSFSYTVAIEYTGHGIGTNLHEQPSVPNYGKSGTGLKLRRGMVMAIEPMIISGSNKLLVADNGWTVYTADRSLCVHYEHTIALTENGTDILTKDIIFD
ncbi:MAG: type I methionyl aminopeptidase [bacterium]